MSGPEIQSLVRQIDEDIASNRQKVERDALAYISSHLEELAGSLVKTGRATIPTFAGEITFTEEDLRKAAHEESGVAA